MIVSEVIAERTRDTDLDKDQRYDEAMKMAQKATQTVDTDVVFNQGTPQEKIDAYKALLRSNAYSVMGTIDFKKENFVAAQDRSPEVDRRLPLPARSGGRAAAGAVRSTSSRSIPMLSRWRTAQWN